MNYWLGVYSCLFSLVLAIVWVKGAKLRFGSINLWILLFLYLYFLLSDLKGVILPCVYVCLQYLVQFHSMHTMLFTGEGLEVAGGI